MAHRPTKNKLFAEVVETAVEFHKRRLWKQLDADDPISIRVEGEEHPLLCFVLGSTPKGLGLSALRGEHAIEGFENVVLTGDNFDVDAPCDMLMMSFTTLSGVNPEYMRVIEQSGRVFGRGSAAPLFMSQQRNERARPMSRPELRLMLTLMQALLVAASNGQLQQRPWDKRRRTLELALEGRGTKATVVDSVRTWPKSRPVKKGKSPFPTAQAIQANEVKRAAPTESQDRLGPWKAADARLDIQLLAAATKNGADHKPRPLRGYFGDENEARRVLSQQQDPTPSACYISWFIFHYRSRKGARTVAEHLQDEGSLPPKEKALLEARLTARPMLGRIKASDPGDWVDVENVVNGDVHRIHDVGLSKSTVEGLGLILEVYRVDGWSFAMLAGPPTPPSRLADTLCQIERLGHEFEAGYLTGDCSLMGTLFLTPKPAPPKLQNTDGEDHEPIPALQGKAPRKAAWDPALRKEVERLIRTYPDVGGPGGPIRVPREEMLRGLGLE